jgi:hypothetical protein
MKNLKNLAARCFLVLGTAALVSCGGGEDKLAALSGTWAVDTVASMAMAENRPGNIFERALTEGILGLTSMELDAANKKLTISKGLLSNTYSFRLLETKGNVITIKTESEGKEIVFEIKDDNTIILRDNGEAMVMIRKK